MRPPSGLLPAPSHAADRGVGAPDGRPTRHACADERRLHHREPHGRPSVNHHWTRPSVALSSKSGVAIRVIGSSRRRTCPAAPRPVPGASRLPRAIQTGREPLLARAALEPSARASGPPVESSERTIQYKTSESKGVSGAHRAARAHSEGTCSSVPRPRHHRGTAATMHRGCPNRGQTDATDPARPRRGGVRVQRRDAQGSRPPSPVSRAWVNHTALCGSSVSRTAHAAARNPRVRSSSNERS